MKQTFITNNNHSDLLLIFSGWGTHADLFSGLSIKKNDICVCYDYRNDSFDSSLFLKYKHITVIGWSFGVWMAAYTLSKTNLKIDKSIAINGTMHPIDDEYGIPQTIFYSTLQSLTDESFSKFQRRICGNTKKYDKFKHVLSKRDIQEVTNELNALKHKTDSINDIPFLWNIAYIADKDLIFTADRQEAFWNKYTLQIRKINDSHLPDFKCILDELFN